jgi:hypothetical protein
LSVFSWRFRETTGRDSVDHPSHGSDDYANVIAGALNVATREVRRPGVGFGGPGYAPDGGKIVWEDAGEREHSRVRIVHMSEREWIEAKEKEHLR